MEKELLFYLGEDLLDVTEQEQLRFFMTFSIADISSLEIIKNAASKTVTFPGTDNNRKLFGFAELPSSGSGLDQTTKPSFRVEYDGTPILYGFIKMVEPVYDVENELTFYKAVLVGDNGEWKADIKGQNLMDLDFSEQDHVYNKANIDTSETVSASRAYVYPLINHGHPQAEAGDILDGNHDVAVEDRTPAWQVSPLLIKLFNVIGYKVDSTFFDTGFGSKLYIPFGKESMLYDDSFAKEGAKHFRAGRTTPLVITGQTNNNKVIFNLSCNVDNNPPAFFDTDGLYNTSTFTYTVDIKSKMDFAARILLEQVTPDTTERTIVVRFKKNGVAFKTNNFYAPAGLPIGSLGFNTGYREYEPGDTVTVEIEYSTLGTGFNTLSLTEDALFWNTVSSKVVKGEIMPVNRTLPDILQSDFLDWLKKLFHLYFYADIQRKIIFIEPRDDFYTGTALEWSDKVDLAKSIKTKFLGDNLNRTVRYRYTADSDDKFVEEVEQQRDELLGAHDEIIANKFAQKGIKEILTGFAPTFMDTMPGIGLATTQVPKIWDQYRNDPEVPWPWRTAFAHRILYYAGVVSVADGDEWTFEGVARTDYPYFYSVNNITENDNSLYFDDQSKSVGLFNKFYKNVHRIIDEGKLITMSLYLTETDINNLDYRTPIHIEIKGDSGFYTLNKIKKYSPLQKGSTEVELLQFLDVHPAPSAKQSTQALTDQIPDTAGDPIPDGGDRIINFDVPDNNVFMEVSGGGNPHPPITNTLNLSRGMIPNTFDQVLLGQNGRPNTKYSVIIGNGPNEGNRSNGLVIDENGVILAQEGRAGYTLLPAKNIIDSSVAPPTEVDGDIYILDNANGVLAVDSILHQSGSLIRYSSAGADLSAVTAGDWLEVKGSTNAINDGRFVIKTVNDGSDFVELVNVLRTDATDDEGAAGTMSAVFTDYDSAAQGDWIKYFATDDLWIHIPALKGTKCYLTDHSIEYLFNGVAWAQDVAAFEDHFIMGFDIRIDGSLRTTIGISSVRNDCKDFLNTFNITGYTVGSNNLAVPGVDGLDTGTVAGSTWYWLYVIASSTDPITFPTASLASLADTTPAVLPTGYDKYRMIGVVLTNAGATAIEPYFQVVSPFSQHIRRYYWDRDRAASIFDLSGGRRTVWTPISFSTLLPLRSKGIGHLTMEYTVTTLATNKARFRPAGSTQTDPPHSFTEPGVTSNPLVIPFDLPWNDPEYEYKVDDAFDFVELYCTGFTQAI